MSYITGALALALWMTVCKITCDICYRWFRRRHETVVNREALEMQLKPKITFSSLWRDVMQTMIKDLDQLKALQWVCPLLFVYKCPFKHCILWTSWPLTLMYKFYHKYQNCMENIYFRCMVSFFKFDLLLNTFQVSYYTSLSMKVNFLIYPYLWVMKKWWWSIFDTFCK